MLLRVALSVFLTFVPVLAGAQTPKAQCAALARMVQDPATGVWDRDLDVPAAEAACNAALAIDPADDASRAYLARVYGDSDRDDAALKEFALLTDTTDPDAAGLAAWHFSFGPQMDLDTAHRLARRAAAADNVYGTYRLARVLLKKDTAFYDLEEGLRVLERAIDMGSPFAVDMKADRLMYGDDASDADKAASLALYEQAAEMGAPIAMADLGRAYRWGIGAEVDAEKAREWWTKGSTMGDDFSSYYLAFMHRDGTGGPVDMAEAERLFLLAAKQGRDKGLFQAFYLTWKKLDEGERGLPYLMEGVAKGENSALDQYARLLRAGIFMEKDLNRAVDYFIKAAEAGRAASRWEAFGEVFDNLPDRMDEAVTWARDGAARGEAVAIRRLADCYKTGKGVAKDPKEAARLYELAHLKGEGYGSSNLAIMIADGSAGFRDTEMAVELLQHAVDQGADGALEELAAKYQKGEGVARDDAKAIELLKRAMESGQLGLNNQLGYTYANAEGAVKDLAEAAKYYRLAATEDDSRVAMSNLAEAYELGNGVEADPELARSWYKRSADKGHPRAIYKFAMFRLGDGIPEQMTETAEMLAEAADKGWTKALARIEAAFDDPDDPLHAVVMAPSDKLADRFVSFGLFSERARIDCGIILTDCGRVADQRLDLAEAAKWYRRAAVTLPGAQFFLGRLLSAHPQFAAHATEGRDMLDAASDAGRAEARILIALADIDGLEQAEVDTRLNAALQGLEPKRGALLAALASVGRFGDSAIGAGWRWLAARADEGVAEAEVGRFMVTMFFGAFDEAAEKLAALPPEIEFDLNEVDYSLRQALRFWMENVRDGVTPSEAQLDAVARLLAAFEARQADSAREMSLMLEEVRLRLASRDDFEPMQTRPEKPIADRIAQLSDRITEKNEGPGLSPLLVPLYHDLAALQIEAGHSGEAERSVYQAMRIAREMNDATRHLTGSLVYHMEMACWLRKGSDLLFRAGRDAAGLTLAKSAVNELQAARGTLMGLPEDLQNCFRDLLSSQYRQMADLLIRQNHLNEAQWVLDQLKDFQSYRYANRDTDRAGQSFAEITLSEAQKGVMAKIHGLPLTETLALSRQIAELEDKGDEAGAEALRVRLEDAQDALADSLDTLIDEVEDLDTAGESEIPDAVSARNLRRLGGRLRDLPGVAIVYSVSLPERTHFLIVTRDGTEHRTLDVTEAELNQRIRDLRAALSDPRVDPRALAQAFYADYWAGVETILDQIGTTQVLLSFDGLLRYVPVSALHDGQDWLVAHRDYITFTAASRDLLLDDETLEDIEVEALGATRGGAGFSALPYVRNEIDAIVGKGGGSGLVSGRAHIDDAFDLNTFRDALESGAPVIHVATHFRLTENEASSAMLLGDGGMLSVADLKKGARRGRFFLGDVSMLVLSACQTALARGSELESLASEMQYEGVRTVLATLWPVADRSTAQFMAAFYERLSNGESRAGALRQVQTAFAANISAKAGADEDRGGKALKPGLAAKVSMPGYSHPFYWAGFQLIGQWR